MKLPNLNLKPLRLGTLLGFPVELGWSFFVLFGAVSVGSGPIGGLVAIIAFVSILLHELGHAVVARRHGAPVRGILLHAFGGFAIMEIPREPIAELAIAAAGPVVSLLLALVSFNIYRFTENGFVGAIGLINGMLLAFNLLPVFPMDGGRILRALLARRWSYVRATDIAVWIARGLIVVLVPLAFVMGAYTAIVLALLIWLLGASEKRAVRITP